MPAPHGSTSGSELPDFESPRRPGRTRFATVGAAIAVLAVGVALTALEDRPDGVEDIGLDAGHDEPIAGELTIEEPTTEEPTAEEPDAPDDADGQADDPGSLRPSTRDADHVEDALESHADLAEVDSPSGALVVAGSAGIAVVDLATGDVDKRADDGPSASGRQGLAVVGDTIVQAHGVEVRLHPLDLTDEPTVLDVRGSHALEAPDGTVWVGGYGASSTSGARQRWTPIDPAGAIAGEPIDAPAHDQVLGATEDGLALRRSGRAFVVGHDGRVRTTLGEGVLLDAGAGGLLWHVCTDEVVCRLAVTDADEGPGDSSALAALEGWQFDGRSPGHLSGDGHRAVVRASRPGKFGVGVVDLAEDEAWMLELDALEGRPTASGDGAWIAALASRPTVWAPEQGLAFPVSLDVGEPAAVALQ